MVHDISVTGAKPVWSRIANIGNTLNSTVRIDMDKDRMEITAVDQSHVALWEMEIPSEAFAEYTVAKTIEEEIPLDIVTRSLRTMKKQTDLQKMTLSSDRLLTLENQNQDLWWHLQGQPQKVRTPDLDFKANVVVIPTAWLLDALLAVNDYNNLATFTTDPKQALFYIESSIEERESTTGTTLKYHLLEERGEKPPEEYARQTFALQYLIPIMRKLKSEKCASVELWIMDKFPLKLVGEWDDGTKLTLFLAPRISND